MSSLFEKAVQGRRVINVREIREKGSISGQSVRPTETMRIMKSQASVNEIVKFTLRFLHLRRNIRDRKYERFERLREK